MRKKDFSNSTNRVKKYRDNMRANGLRPVQIWIPDTRSLNFQQECLRQSKIVSQANVINKDLDNFIDDALNDIQDWT